MSVSKPVTHTKSTPITKVGHTTGQKFGVNPNLKAKGSDAVTEQTFGK